MAEDNYRKPSLTVDILIFTIRENQLQVLLIERGGEPFKGSMAIPGGFLEPDEDYSLLEAARRELKEETGVDAPYLQQLGAYGNRDRDPRDWVATVAYFALLPAHLLKPEAGSDATRVSWVTVQGEGVDCALAFDHKDILGDAIKRLRASLEDFPIAAYPLADDLTLRDLNNMREVVVRETSAEKSTSRSSALG